MKIYGPIHFIKKDFVYKCERWLELHGECLQDEPIFIVHKFRNDKTNIMPQEKLNIVGKKTIFTVYNQNVEF